MVTVYIGFTSVRNAPSRNGIASRTLRYAGTVPADFDD
jgi:hypothetical protein